MSDKVDDYLKGATSAFKVILKAEVSDAYQKGQRDALTLKPIAEAPKDGRMILAYKDKEPNNAPSVITWLNVRDKDFHNWIYADVILEWGHQLESIQAEGFTHFIEIPQSMKPQGE